MPRPAAVTIVAWLLIADTPVTLLALLFTLRFPEAAEAPLPPWHLALAAVQALAFLLAGVLLLRGRDAGRWLFWLGAPAFIVADAIGMGFNWVDALRIALCVGISLALLLESARRYFQSANPKSALPGGSHE